MLFTPLAAIWVKSISTTLRAGYGAPWSPGLNVPYVTPRTQNFSPPTKRNFPEGRGRGKLACAAPEDGAFSRVPRHGDTLGSIRSLVEIEDKLTFPLSKGVQIHRRSAAG